MMRGDSTSPFSSTISGRLMNASIAAIETVEMASLSSCSARTTGSRRWTPSPPRPLAAMLPPRDFPSRRRGVVPEVSR